MGLFSSVLSGGGVGEGDIAVGLGWVRGGLKRVTFKLFGFREDLWWLCSGNECLCVAVRPRPSGSVDLRR